MRVFVSDLFFAKSLANERPNKRTKACHIRSLQAPRGRPEGKGGRQAKVSTPALAWVAGAARAAATGATGALAPGRLAPG